MNKKNKIFNIVLASVTFFAVTAVVLFSIFSAPRKDEKNEADNTKANPRIITEDTTFPAIELTSETHFENETTSGETTVPETTKAESVIIPDTKAKETAQEKEEQNVPVTEAQKKREETVKKEQKAKETTVATTPPPPPETRAETTAEAVTTEADTTKAETANAVTTQAETTETVIKNEPTSPNFTVYDDYGNKVSLHDFVGKPIVLNFWATWCGPCKHEMPDFNEKYLELGSEVQFIMINLTDGTRETVEGVKAFIAENGYSFPVFFDKDYSAVSAYAISSIPTTYFIDSEGNLVAYAKGAISRETLQEGIDMIT